MKAVWRGRVIAESDRTLEVGGYTYFPRATVRMDLLHAVPKTEGDLACPHGVQFYDVTERRPAQRAGGLVLRSATPLDAAGRSLDRLSGRTWRSS